MIVRRTWLTTQYQLIARSVEVFMIAEDDNLVSTC